MRIEELGIRVARRRKQLNMTQSDLAEALDVSYQQVQKYESGATNISVSKLIQIAKALQVEASYFFEDYNLNYRSMESVEEVRPPKLLTRKELFLLQTFRNILTPEQQQLVLHLMHELSDRGKRE